MFRHPSSVHDNGRIGIGLSILIVTVAALCHVFSGQPHPSEGAEAIARAGGVFGWMLANPLLWLGTSLLAVPVIVLLLVLSLFIITKTPPNRLPSRLRELYSYLFGAQLQTDEERAAAKAQGAAGKNDSVQFGSLTDIGLGDDDTGSLPWWRRNKSQPAEDKAFDSPVISRDQSTEIVPPKAAAAAVVAPTAPPAAKDLTKKEGEFGVELLEELHGLLARAQAEDRDVLVEVEVAPAVGEVDGADLAEQRARRHEVASREQLLEVGEIDLKRLH